MQTPAGKDCKHYFEDYNRGRNIKECRLARANPDSLPWRPSDCKRCPVPDILYANASPDLALKLTIDAALFGLSRKLTVSAHCIRHDIPISEPKIGCPQCNAERPGLDLFRQALEQPDDD